MRTVLCILFMCASAAADEPRTMFEYVERYGPGLGMDLTMQPLTSQHVERWAELLGASDPQCQVMEHMHEEFVRRHNEFMDGEAERYCKLSNEKLTLWQTTGPSTEEYAVLQKKFDKETARIRQRLTLLEYSYIDSIQPVLTQEQIDRVPLLQADAKRRNCGTITSFVRWTNTELRDLWAASAEPLATPAERTRVEEILADYESRLTQRVCACADLQFEIRQSLTRNRIDRTLQRVSADEGRARYSQVRRKWVAASGRIRALNEETFERIRKVLAEETAEVFAEFVKRTVFPELYPDSSDLHPLFTELVQDDALGRDGLEAAAHLSRDYAVQHQRLCEELEEFCVDWNDRMEEDVAEYHQRFFADALKPLLERRTNLSRNMLKSLDEVLGTEWRSRHAAMIPAPLRDRDAASAELTQ